MLSWAVGVLLFCGVGGKQDPCCFRTLLEMEVAISVMLCHVLRVSSAQVGASALFS